MNTKHTPGPWAASRHAGPYCNTVAIEYAPGERIGYAAFIPNRADGNASQFANAALMAAAPDLLDALNLLMSDPSRKALLPDTVLAARAAIAKATNV